MTNQRIIFSQSDGTVAVIIPAESVELALKDVPEGVSYEIVTTDDIPSDRTFRGAWVQGDCCVEHDIDKCKGIAHDKRRAARSEEFKPHDELISKQIPGSDTDAAEAARSIIRTKYATMQTSIDNAATTAAINTALEGGAE